MEYEVIEENPFNHILYEFMMYLITFPISVEDQYSVNMKIDSHLIHLRNLAYFFDKKQECDIKASIYVNNADSCLIESKKLGEIYHITNSAACHMSKERLKSSFKSRTMACEKTALGVMIPVMDRYLMLLDTDINPQYADLWRDERIQGVAYSLRQTLAAASITLHSIMLEKCDDEMGTTSV